jgi:hypothetical protein
VVACVEDNTPTALLTASLNMKKIYFYVGFVADLQLSLWVIVAPLRKRTHMRSNISCLDSGIILSAITILSIHCRLDDQLLSQ